MIYTVGKENFIDFESATRQAAFRGKNVQVWHRGMMIRVMHVNRLDIHPDIRRDYSRFSEFVFDMRTYWNFAECLEVPCVYTLSYALELMERSRDAGEVSQMYTDFIRVCQNDRLLERADRIFQDFQEQDSPFVQWLDNHEDDWK